MCVCRNAALGAFSIPDGVSRATSRAHLDSPSLRIASRARGMRQGAEASPLFLSPRSLSLHGLPPLPPLSKPEGHAPPHTDFLLVHSLPSLPPSLAPHALTPALSPALTAALSPALTPALTPALSPTLALSLAMGRPPLSL